MRNNRSTYHESENSILRLLDRTAGFLQSVKGPLIVAGDFNDEPTGGAYKLMLTKFRDAWIDGKGKDAGFSYPADKPTKRIDYVFTRKSDRIRAKQARIVDTLASDHRPLVVALEVR